MFWHGRPFGLRLANFVIWCLTKMMLLAWAKVFFNFANGFSGHQPADGFMYLFVDSVMTVHANGMYCIFDQDLSLKNCERAKGEKPSESHLRFHMSDMFLFSRVTIQRFYMVYTLQAIFMMVCGAWTYLVFVMVESESVMNVDGQMLGLYAFGVFMSVIVVLVHHI